MLWSVKQKSQSKAKSKVESKAKLKLTMINLQRNVCFCLNVLFNYHNLIWFNLIMMSKVEKEKKKEIKAKASWKRFSLSVVCMSKVITIDFRLIFSMESFFLSFSFKVKKIEQPFAMEFCKWPPVKSNSFSFRFSFTFFFFAWPTLTNFN